MKKLTEVSQPNRTGKIKGVIGYNGKSARVYLSSGERICIPTTHRPVIGDWVVEGELSNELMRK
ncbi:hypothetical protein BOO91_14660 [Vibrio navarrensis]|nr:hypothetical protein UF06_19290 [Vibrio sp. S234-5]MBE3662172.1 hypothetical protein [Vibrio navarrensis]